MSPEQARGAAVDKRADIWAFGVVLYEMLTARRTFAEDTVSDTLAAVLKTTPDWGTLPPDTPAPIRRLLRRCLERDRKKRLPDIADARLEIDEALAGSLESPAPVAPPPARAMVRWSVAVLALVALAGVVVSVPYFRMNAPQPVTVRFQIPAPEKVNFGNYGMALSPDGRRLAFIAVNSEGRSMLWVRPLDSLAAVALPGTEGAIYTPFWSPDSRSIGFVGQGKVRKIEASGGPPQTLCEGSGNLLGGSWGRDGTILFGSSTGGLFRVNQAGGVPSLQTTPDSTQGEIAHMRPWFLPDGRHFLYVTRNSQPDKIAIYLATLDGKERKRLVGSRQAGAYVPPSVGSGNGHLLFLRDGTLMAQPLDTRRFELAGEPFPVAEQVGSALALGYFSVSSNGALAYRAGGSGGNTQLMWFDRDGKALGALGPPTNYGSVALAPDGKRVAVDRIDPTGNSDIWVLDAAREVPTRFTFDPATDQVPVWSPDGTRLIFASNRSDSGVYGIYQKDAGGSGNEQLLLKSGRPDDISPDGRYLLYSVLDDKTLVDLWVFPLTGAADERKPAPYLQTQFSERQGKFSPDGRWIAYSSNESGPEQYQIYVQSFPAGSGKFMISAGGGTQPRWRRDGKEIFYIAADGKVMAVDVKTAPKFEAGAPKALFNPRIVNLIPFTYFRYDVTGDGKRFLVNSFGGAAESSPSAPITVVLNWQAAVKR
jgi:Tol biopolymer transport system component